MEGDDEVQGEPDQATTLVTLRVFCDDRDPAEIGAMLQSPATRSWKKGDYYYEAGRKKRAVAKTGVWLLEGHGDHAAPLGNKVLDLLERVSKDASVWAQIRSSCRADISCGIFVHDDYARLALDSRVLQQLSVRGLQLTLDVWPVQD